MDKATESEMRRRLKECNSFLDMVNVYNEYYDCSARLGAIAKGMIIINLPKIGKIAGFKERLKWSRAKQI